MTAVSSATAEDGAGVRELLGVLQQSLTLPDQSLGFWSGRAGIVWALTHLQAFHPGGEVRDALGDFVEQAIELAYTSTRETVVQNALILMAAVRADRLIGLGSTDQACDELDGFLLDDVLNDDGPSKFELIDGLAGLGTYCLARERAGSAEPLARLMALLERRATAQETGIAWVSTPRILAGFPMLAKHPRGCIDLGMAHGMAGPLALMSLAVERLPTSAPKSRHAVSEGMAFLAAQRNHPPDGDLCFGYVAGDRVRARCAWCYGELGIASALSLASKATNSDEFANIARQLVSSMLARPEASMGVRDPWLCHGTAGLALLFRRLGLWHRIPELERRGEGFARRLEVSVRTLIDGDSGSNTPLDLSLLEGLSGAALTLAESRGELERGADDWALPLLVLPPVDQPFLPNWDRNCFA